MPGIKEKFHIPKEVSWALEKLQESKFEAYLVGGCVRDLLLKRAPKDWDITTNAKPEQIQQVFFDSFYENDFGTVGVKTGSDDPALSVIEVTPYRLEEKYTDKRHPDAVKFTNKLEDDLARRDFTINAIASDVKLNLSTSQIERLELIDPFNGQKDLEERIVRAVGNPEERFEEDALRIMRAIRLASELDFSIEDKTRDAIKKNGGLLEFVSKERIRDEFIKLIESGAPDRGIEEMHELGILKLVLPELEEGIGVTQNKDHVYTVWEHNVRALMHAVEKKWPLKIRIAALLHDVGKPRTKRGEGPDSTFYGHDVVGAKMTAEALARLKFPTKFTEEVAKLVRWHLFFSDTAVITLSAVRRMVRNVGEENIWDLMNVRYCDRIGMGRPKERPFRLRKYESMVEEALRSPLSVSQLTVRGEDVMKICGVEPGPKIGHILHALLEEVLDEPLLNVREHQEKCIAELCKLSDEELKKLGLEAKQKKEAEEEKAVSEIRKKYFVK